MLEVEELHFGKAPWEYFAYSGKKKGTHNSFLGPSGNAVLMQFTGLHDKNRKEIYEGDIVCILYPKSDYEIARLTAKHEVVEQKGKKYVRFLSQAIPIKWSDKDARWVLGEMRKRSEEYGTFGMNGGRLSIRGKTYQVIGNIYENPELLSLPAQTPA